MAKAVFNFPLTRHLIDRLRIDPVLRRMCGFQTVAGIPEEWTFSRAFAEFAHSQFPQHVHTALIERTQADRLVGHISSKGRKSSWVGYKLHGDVADGHILISCVLTAASVNDTQVAIPLAEMTARRVTSLYDLMDGGYVSDQIREHSLGLGHVPLIPRRKNEAPEPMEPHQQVRFGERTSVERVFSRLKDEFGGRFVRVRGAAKVMAHLMFGALALTADQILRWIAPSPGRENVPITP